MSNVFFPSRDYKTYRAITIIVVNFLEYNLYMITFNHLIFVSAELIDEPYKLDNICVEHSLEFVLR